MPRYQYSQTPARLVKEEPEEYIIPDCLEACKILWDKGIDTVECSNFYDDVNNYRYVDIDPSKLSEENKTFLYDKINSNAEGFAIDGVRHNPRIYVHKTGVEAQKRLCELAEMLSLQDTSEYATSEQFLDGYKRTDGEYIDLPDGIIIRDYNPKYKDATLVDALNDTNKWDLFIEEEGRVYNNKEALEHHQHYLSKLKENNNKKSI